MHRPALFFIGSVFAAVLLAAWPAWAADAGATTDKAQPRSRNPRHDPEYQQRSFKGSADAELAYGWLTPLKTATGEKYPLVVCLHGSGGSVKASTVLARQSMREQFPAFVMVPEADRSFTWAKTDVINRRGRTTDLSEKMPVLIEAIQALLKSEAIDPTRVYITGQSMGGIGSWGAITRHPELFAAAVPVCGAWHVEEAPKMAGVPVWAFHGEKDPTVPVQFSRDLTAGITKAGGTAKYTEYPGVGHDSWNKAYEEMEMWKWLFAQHKSSGSK